ncbi:Uu.00g140320.m01.CDS01 [Anthostomella pinea]|uniref:Uu.00g140320.m01.CDS01 n=1 Tax=Anthostomella pinea TaxID=933095 RepID=A0AAI8VQ64_9PEZI|nr:Uu.00g140320.m01.CDS01 [Anthostomella pinea]
MASLFAERAFRHDSIPFDPARDLQSSDNPVIQELRETVPDLKIYTRSSPRYESVRQVYNLLNKAQPLVICRPQSIPQVQAIVRTAARFDAPLAVRCGGHDVWGRGCIADSVTIDMREMDTQQLATGGSSVTIGGGVTSDNFVGFLHSHGLCTANGTAGHVGWTGWAIWGGYGPLNDYVGLGVDNILAAKMVTATGDLVEADEDLLWGIRGAGGNLGVIVETRVKVYPIHRILAGFIGYSWDEAEAVLLKLQSLLDNGVPNSLCVQIGFMKSEWGIGMTLIFIWPAPDLDEGKKWLEMVRDLGTVVVDTVAETTFKDFQKITSRPVTDPANVYTRSASIPSFTTATVAELKQRIEAIPDTRQYNVIAHIGHGKSTEPNPSSCFATRQPHVLFHINACDEADEMTGAAAWVDEVVSGLKSTGELMKPVYVSFMGEDENTDQSFGDGWERLKALKRRHDAKDTFRHAQPKLPPM